VRNKPHAIEWPTLLLIIVTYLVWILAGLVLWPIAPLAALIIMAVFIALHSSLVHESIHGHPTRNGTINAALVICNPGLIWPFHRFRTLHLRHHADDRLTDPFDDPESYYRALWYYEGLPNWFQGLLGLSNTLIGRLILGPPMSTIALLSQDISAMWHGDKPVQRAWLFHICGLLPILFLIIWVFQIPLWLYVITACWGGAALISLRTFAEHQWHENPDGRTLIVERSLFSILFLNNNLHLVHHKNPTVPWYQLPALYRHKREHWASLNQGYIFPNYWKLFSSYALIAKEPVVHPVLRRSKEIE
jgi:fatty acid desaturase